MPPSNGGHEPPLLRLVIACLRFCRQPLDGANMANELIQVPFHGAMMEATKTADGRILASIRRDCESLGLDFSSQLAKLKKLPWATVVNITTVAEDGKERACDDSQ